MFYTSKICGQNCPNPFDTAPLYHNRNLIASKKMKKSKKNLIFHFLQTRSQTLFDSVWTKSPNRVKHHILLCRLLHDFTGIDISKYGDIRRGNAC